MIVYIEYVIINNLIIDYLLLRLTFVLTGKAHSKIRLFLCGILGAGLSLIFPLIKLGNLYLTIIKVLVGILLLLLSAKFKSKREFYINFTTFCFLTFFLGGAVFAVYLILGVDYLSETAVFLCFLPAWALLYAIKRVVLFFYRRKDVEKLLYPFEFTFQGVKVAGRGFLDTGNGVYYKDNPVVICEKSLIKEILNLPITYKKLNKMEVFTASGKSENFCFFLDEFKIFIGDKPNIYNNVTLMIGKVNITGADLILHPALVGVNNEREYDRETKKAS